MGSFLTSLEEYKPIDPGDYQSLKAEEEKAEAQTPMQKRCRHAGKFCLFVVLLALIVSGLVPILKNAKNQTANRDPMGGTGPQSGPNKAGTAEEVLKHYITYQKTRGALSPAIAAPAGKDPLVWYAINDIVMGGESSSIVETSRDGGVVWYGVVITEGGGFSSFRADLVKGLPYEVVAVAITTKRGDARQYTINIEQNKAGVNNTAPPSFTAYFNPNANGQSLRVCKTLKDFQAASHGSEASQQAPLDNKSIKSFGLLLNHASGANRDKYGEGVFPFSLTVEKIEWLRTPC
eukprot:gb/GEZN01014766.1/.p1 GENE.gb/GEZN01014766.1/~~gb/GEZN01014766.1/.p1  ORF type:complete len:291 (-),score=44.08 gb/GEZN01014766.1/:13-885(-)